MLNLGYVEAGSPTLGSSRSWKSTEMEIQSLLEKLLDVNDSMSRCAASASSTTSVTQKLARHRDILHEFTQVTHPCNSMLNIVTDILKIELSKFWLYENIELLSFRVHAILE